MKRIYSVAASIFSVAALALVLQGCSPVRDRFTLTIAHINDTHSHVETTPVTLDLNGVRTVAGFGGMARLKTAVDDLRSRKPSLLLLHAGDAVQGTLYFNLFNGKLDFELLNMLGVDAMTFGNHEFDRGPGIIPSFLVTARFPIISANIDFSGEPAIAPLVRPYLIREVDGEKVGIIGVTTETTPISTMTVGKVRFNDSHGSVRKTVAELQRQGINKIIVISHLGYAEDIRLASQVNGVDVIVGGHSHSLLGDSGKLRLIGLSTEGPYPTSIISPDGKKVLVLQAWKWGYVLGSVDVSFSPAGEVDGFTAEPRLVAGESFAQNGLDLPRGGDKYKEIIKTLNSTGMVRIYPENPHISGYIQPYTRQLASYRGNVIASAETDLLQGQNSGPGPLVADSMLAAVPSGRIALMNSGGIRKSLLAGNISVGDVLEVLPFGNTLNIVELSGAELKASLEEGVEFLKKKFAGCNQLPLPYVAGARYTVDTTKPPGKRVLVLEVRDDQGFYKPVQPGIVYRCVVNSFMAGGGDGFSTIKTASRFRSDTGVIDADAFAGFLKMKGKVFNPDEARVTAVPAVQGNSNAVAPHKGLADNYGVQPAAVKAPGQ